MFIDINEYQIYIVTGKTDMRKGINGLVTIIQDELNHNPYDKAIYIFAGIRKDRYKIVYFNHDGFVMVNKRIDNGRVKWPKAKHEPFVKVTSQQFEWFSQGLSIYQKNVIKPSQQGVF